MTTKTDEQERQTFEAWYVTQTTRDRDWWGWEEEHGQYGLQHSRLSWAAWQAGRAALQSQDREDAEPILAKKHTGMMVDYSGLLMQVANALVAGEREPALAGMLRQLQEHLTELGLRYYEGDTAAIDEFLQLYCIAIESRRRIEGEENA